MGTASAGVIVVAVTKTSTAPGEQPTVQTGAPAYGRFRSTWRAAHETVPGVPRWARTAALLVPLVVLPSSIWRIVVVTFHAPLYDGPRGAGDLPAWLPLELYVVLLSVVSEVLAFAAVGLVATWGEVFPRWLPLVRGRRVPTAVAVVPATAGAISLTVLWTWSVATSAIGRDIQGDRMPDDSPLALDTWDGVIAFAAYAPLVLWGPLLAAVTFAYWRRRRTPRWSRATS